MEPITGSFAVATFVVIALPGLVYAAVSRWARGEGPGDRDFGLTVARGAVFAVALTGIYMLVFGDFLGAGITSGADADTLVVGDPRSVALVVLVLYIALPGAIAVALNYRHFTWKSADRLHWLRFPRSKYGYSATPTAWDHAGRKHQASWVKIRKPNGDWIGGWFTKGSFASAYPESRSIYIDQQYEMSSDGDFIDAIPGAGVYLTVSDDDVVIWVEGQPQESKMGVSSEQG